jgi:cytochrome c oxidase subunit 3
MQGYEWSHLIGQGMYLFGNPWGASLFGTTFFLITGFHGLHVTGGVIYLSIILAGISRFPDRRYNYMITEIAGLYWHFVDLVWIMVFTFIYLL